MVPPTENTIGEYVPQNERAKHIGRRYVIQETENLLPEWVGEYPRSMVTGGIQNTEEI